MQQGVVVDLTRAPWQVYLFVAAFIVLAFIGLFRVSELLIGAVLRATVGAIDGATPSVVALIVVAVVAAVSIWQWRRSRRPRSANFGFAELRTPDLTEDQMRQLDELASLSDEMQRAMEAPSSLRRVVAIGKSILAGSVTVEFLMLEIRDSTGRLTVETRDPQGREEEQRFSASQTSRREVDMIDWVMPLRPILRVTDDAGTKYRVSEAGGGGNAGAYRSEIYLLPAPPASASMLRITVDRLSSAPELPIGGPRRDRVVEGPWSIDVEL